MITAVSMKMDVFWNAVLCSLIEMTDDSDMLAVFIMSSKNF